MPGKRAFGVTVAYSTTSGGTYTNLANLTKVRPFNLKAEMMDTTSHDSTGAYREKVATLLDAGQVGLDLNYDDKAATHAYLVANLGVNLYWKITFPGTSPTVASFQGFVTNVGPEVPFDNKMTASATIEITGPVTIV